jgi:uncharacterized protein with ParB-like and HNH nuclease domain
MSIQSIINQIHNEEIVLPAIQRCFVWEKVKIQKLMDSLIEGTTLINGAKNQ